MSKPAKTVYNVVATFSKFLRARLDMSDVYGPETRSYVMSRIRAIDTKPEIFVRSVLHRNGYRFRLHRKDLPGTPDIVLPKYMSVIFVHGCFWHQHENCKLAKKPKSNKSYWIKKLKRNVERDKENVIELRHLGWNVLIVWECEITEENALIEKLNRFLS